MLQHLELGLRIELRYSGIPLTRYEYLQCNTATSEISSIQFKANGNKKAPLGCDQSHLKLDISGRLDELQSQFLDMDLKRR